MNIIFLHGFLGNNQEFDCIKDQIKAQVYTLELPYHSTQKQTCTTSFKNINEWLNSEINKLKINDYVLYGYSLGGRIVCSYLANLNNFENRLKGVILESCNFGPHNYQERKNRYSTDLKWALKFVNEKQRKCLSDWYDQQIFKNLSIKQKEELINKRLNFNKENIANAITNFSFSKMKNCNSLLQQANIPILYINGQYDDKYKNISIKLQKFNNKNVITKQISNAGHNCHYEQPKEITNLINDFIKNL